MRFWISSLCLLTCTSIALAEIPDPSEPTGNQPSMAVTDIAAQAKEASSATGVSVPLTMISFGTIVLGPATR
jgi:hypothetical protein